MTDLQKHITQKNQLEVVETERRKLTVEANNMNREILEITNSINVIRKNRIYLKSEDVRVVSIKEYSSMISTLVRLEKDRDFKREEYKKKKEELDNKINQSKSLKSILGESGEPDNILQFPAIGIYA